MGIVTLPSFGSDPATVTAAALDGKVDPLATEFNGNIENANVKAAAAIAYSKLNLTGSILNADINTSAAIVASKLSLATIAQVIAMSGSIFKWAKGADVASAAGAITLGEDGNFFDITGTAAITSITAKTVGTLVMLQFDSTASLVDGSNLKLAGSFTGAAESTITLISDGTNWYEISRSPSYIPAASNALTGSMVQQVNVQTGAVATGTTVTVYDDTIPQNSEGNEYMTLAITPTNASNKLKIDIVWNGATSANADDILVMLFQDSTAGALACASCNSDATSEHVCIAFTHYMTAGTTSATTFKVRAGMDVAGTTTFNGAGGARKYGGVFASSITISEIKV